jgi:hypothetical protein
MTLVHHPPFVLQQQQMFGSLDKCSMIVTNEVDGSMLNIVDIINKQISFRH